MIKTAEAFLRGAIGTIIGLIPAKYFFDSIPLIVIVAGLGGIIGEVLIPKLLPNEAANAEEKKPKTGIPKLMIGLILSIVFALGCFHIYMTYDKYEVGQKLRVVTFTNVRMAEKPFFKDKSNNLVDMLHAGEMVTYVSKQPRRLGRRTALNYYLDFWREVKTEDGKQGWVYGAYLEDR